MPGSASSAAVSTAARSRLGSPNACCTCSPSQIAPSSRTSAGAAPGSSVHSSTERSGSDFRVSGAVAAGTNSRIAITSHSPGIPAKGRAVNTGGGPDGSPWHAL